MAQPIVRNIDDELVARLKIRAAIFHQCLAEDLAVLGLGRAAMHGSMVVPLSEVI